MYKRPIAALLVLFLLSGMSGCSYVPYASEPEDVIILPEPEDEPINMILGERIASAPESFTMYYVSGDGSSFSTITRSLTASFGNGIYSEAIEALFSGVSVPDRVSFFPKEIRLLNTEYAQGILTVNLSLEALTVEGEQEMLMLLATMTNTLLSINGVQAVNLLIDGSAISIADLPVGAQTHSYTGITPAYAQMNTEKEFFLESSSDTITRDAVLYFPSAIGSRLIPEVRTITIDSSDYASVLIRALREGPLNSACTIGVIPEGVDLLVNNPLITIDSSGRRILQLEFSPTLRNYLAFSGIEDWQFISSIALTLISFVPHLYGVQITIGNEMITECRIDERQLVFPGGIITPSDFDLLLGSTVTLYLPNKSGTLNTVERAVSADRALSPLSLLHALFDAILAWDSGAKFFPEGVYYNDILGISVEDGIAEVNLSANFYRQSQALDAASERGVVYAMVNTLCGLDFIQGVRFYIEGISAETLSGSIYLKSVLLPNPGLVSSQSPAVPEITASP